MSDEPETPWGSIDTPDGSRAKSKRLIEAARRRVQGPAIGLMTVGAINAGLGALILVLAFAQRMNLGKEEGLIGAIGCLGGGATAAGGYQLRLIRHLRLARTASIVAMIPCVSPCLILGLPIGFWALNTVTSPDVVSGFEALRRQREEL